MCICYRSQFTIYLFLVYWFNSFIFSNFQGSDKDKRKEAAEKEEKAKKVPCTFLGWCLNVDTPTHVVFDFQLCIYLI